MTIATEATLMTVEQFLALPEDGMDRELIAGQLREKPMTVRNNMQSSCLIKIGKKLANWVDAQPEPRGDVVGGEAGFRLQNNPGTVVGIDVAYISSPTFAADRNARIISGSPVLAVEILSPSDTQDYVNEKVDLYLRAGVQVVWIAEPKFKTVTVYQPSQEPALFNLSQILDGGPHLPGFSVRVGELFA